MTIFRRPGSPNWYFDFIVEGSRHAGSTKTANRREAAKVEAEERKKAKGPAPGTPSPALTLGDAMSRLYIERWARTRDGARVKVRGERIVALLGGPETPLASIDSAAISRMVAALRQPCPGRSKGLRDSSCNRYLSTLTTLLLTAQREWGVLDKVPFIRLAKESRGRLRTFTIEEEARIDTLLRTYAPPKQSQRYLSRRGFDLYEEAADLFAVLLDTGMRLGEAVALECRDVNLDTGLIHVWKNKSDRPRSIPMTERVRGIVEPRLELGRPRVFLLSCADAEGVWRRRIKKLPEFADAVLHSARHTYASRLVTLGVPLYSLTKLLGHASSKMTERYSHLAPESFRESARLLDSLRKHDGVVNMHSVATVVGDATDTSISQRNAISQPSDITHNKV